MRTLTAPHRQRGTNPTLRVVQRPAHPQALLTWSEANVRFSVLHAPNPLFRIRPNPAIRPTWSGLSGASTAPACARTTQPSMPYSIRSAWFPATLWTALHLAETHSGRVATGSVRGII